MYIQKAIARKDGKQEAKGKIIGKTHSKTDISNYLFRFCQDQKTSA